MLFRSAEDAATLLSYTVEANVGGKLAQLGGRLIDATARKLAGDFFRKFGAVVGPLPSEAVPAPAPHAKKAGWLRRWLGRRGGGSGGQDAST